MCFENDHVWFRKFHRALHTLQRKNVKPVDVVGHLVLGLASGLEAFSREPPCDGVGALAARQTPETSGTASEFLSYYLILPSRYQRDPLNNLTKEFCCGASSYDGRSRPSQPRRRRPKGSPRFALRDESFSRNSQLSRVKPTCLTTV